MTAPDWTRPARPYAIAHRGAAAYAPDNTLEAFRIASRIGADMWEVDIRMTSDGEIIAFHDKILSDGRKIIDTPFADILAHTTAEHRPCPRLRDVVAEAAKLGAGIYADIKDTNATLPTLHMLQEHGIIRAILGAFDPQAAQILAEANSPYPRSVLVPLGAEPFSYAKGADVIHLCWERMERPQDTLTDELFERAFANGQTIAIWHEEDPERMAAIRTRPVIGICSDLPELVNQPGHGLPFQTVCHRGANKIAPENTLPAFECALAAGFDYIECDLHETADGEIVIHHDPTLERTANGHGPITAQTLDALRDLDAGHRFSPHFTGTKIPTLVEVFDLLNRYNGKAYLELKSAPPAPVWQAVCDAGLQERVFFWSFNHAALKELRARAPTARIMARRQDYATLQETLDDLAPQIVEFILPEGTEEFVAVRDAGAQVMVAAMADDPAILSQVIAAAPDLANVDHPFALARQVRA
ncbi:glycerophosphodiester phosphodiesterase family protein [Celeribacter halophilus]|uniref:glycerophosphodiester phosphodiesterase n=1 Tax=Celeribacter halophilus TaxID=576117 RepID=UPI0026E14A38|nr:glycerophosphodiester phosphodiesterase family protein [Celeribacter halophilus]MDO6724547.1 glycerophosphodiester phosphodiesterase family protein [Celeribacter halophilus]